MQLYRGKMQLKQGLHVDCEKVCSGENVHSNSVKMQFYLKDREIQHLQLDEHFYALYP